MTLTQELTEYLWYFIKVFTVVLLTYLLLKNSVIRNFKVEGLSMAPNYHTADLIFVNKIAKSFGDISRGDVVVFQEPDSTCPVIGEKNACYLIKRIIGLPGETVYTKEGSVYIINKSYKEGIKLDESNYLANTMKTFSDGKNVDTQVVFGPIPSDSYFVLGDNRTNSIDSRFSQVSFIKRSQIEGKEFFNQQKGFFHQPKYNIGNN